MILYRSILHFVVLLCNVILHVTMLYNGICRCWLLFVACLMLVLLLFGVVVVVIVVCAAVVVGDVVAIDC